VGRIAVWVAEILPAGKGSEKPYFSESRNHARGLETPVFNRGLPAAFMPIAQAHFRRQAQ